MAEENPSFVDLVDETDVRPTESIERQHEEKREEIEAAFGTVGERVEYHERKANEAMLDGIKEITNQAKPIIQKYGLSKSWSKGRNYKKPFDYLIESSGQECKIRRLDMGDLLKLGIAEEMDFMTKALMTSEKKETGGEAVSSAILQAGNFGNMEGMINKVVLAGLLAPKFHHPPLLDNGEVDEDSKKDDTLYVDDIPFTDRMELFSVIFDSDGLATFRTEQTDGVGNVETMPSVSLPAD